MRCSRNNEENGNDSFPASASEYLRVCWKEKNAPQLDQRKRVPAITRFCTTTESNTVFQTSRRQQHYYWLYSNRASYTFSSPLNNFPLNFLKNVGCNTNTASQRLFDRNQNSLRPVQRNCAAHHSMEFSDKAFSTSLFNVTLADWFSNIHFIWVVSNCRNDFLFEILWPIQKKSEDKPNKYGCKGGEKELCERQKIGDRSDSSKLEVTSFSVKNGSSYAEEKGSLWFLSISSC